MTTSNSLLIELFVEELPPKALKKLGEAFANTLIDSLKTQGLADENSVVTAFASPRRLAAQVTQVVAQAADKPASQKLMPVGVALDAGGQATPALLKRLGAMGLDAGVLPQLRRAPDGKGEALFFDSVATGATLVVGLQKALDEALAKLPIPKVMTYQLQDGWSTVNFVRPAHGLVALYGDEVVAISTLGLNAGRDTRGHRFEAAVDPVSIKDADSYAAQMATEGAVIASFAERRAEIERQLLAAAAKVGGGVKPIDDDALLDEVTALVERPNVLLCQFEAEYLDVPQECLILTMKANQKYFPLLDAAGKLTNQFLIVSNISPADPSAVIGGNERVVRPRLADAKFFFDQDRKKPLAARVEALDKVVYHNKLGSQGTRGQKVQLIAAAIASMLGGQELEARATQAATLAKADLLTDMVGEFPELQGIMGRYYALHDGLAGEVADAIEDHYKPRFAGDVLPRNVVGLCVALADKLETLVGLFGIGQVPTGDKDPFALRRHALGVIRILMERDLPLQLDALLAVAAGVRGFTEEVASQVAGFMFERLSGQLREQGYSAQEVDAVVSQRPQRLGDIPKRLAAVREFAALPEAASLAAANKRVGNILKKVEGAVEPVTSPYLLQEAAEIALNAALAEVEPVADAAFDSGDYAASLKSLAALKGPVDDFFDGVMVNVEDVSLRNNRLGLLARLHRAMNRVADLSRLAA
ncbi:MAG: glycine--tRNA ligase subunit beta [Pseudomonadota bacterium]|nr:glycine--tRNA ligase subunit beta [Pseudomonadota bacterium]MDP1904333.1 glycine--tRNA ligase subunit beta [Pseudomonadota bacterium]MDP2353460.1 glycine--tRNA ligase subunit beta [Pseudomonadota bacterium]